MNGLTEFDIEKAREKLSKSIGSFDVVDIIGQYPFGLISREFVLNDKHYFSISHCAWGLTFKDGRSFFVTEHDVSPL